MQCVYPVGASVPAEDGLEEERCAERESLQVPPLSRPENLFILFDLIGLYRSLSASGHTLVHIPSLQLILYECPAKVTR